MTHNLVQLAGQDSQPSNMDSHYAAKQDNINLRLYSHPKMWEWSAVLYDFKIKLDTCSPLTVENLRTYFQLSSFDVDISYTQ